MPISLYGAVDQPGMMIEVAQVGCGRQRLGDEGVERRRAEVRHQVSWTGAVAAERAAGFGPVRAGRGRGGRSVR